MPLTQDQPPARVLAYAPGEVRLADRTLRTSALVTPRAVLDWPVTGIATLTPEDLAPALALRPAVILLASDAPPSFPPANIYAAAAAAGAGLEVMDLGAACRTYNVLLGEERAVVLALILGRAP
jgi:uncharacterized protein